MKEAAFEISEVVNWLLESYDSNQYRLTNLKLNKVAYFLHAVSLAKIGEPLIRNHFESWDYGPVVASLYHRLKHYGDGPISKKIESVNYETGKYEEVKTDRIKNEVPELVKKAAKFFVEKDVDWLVQESHEKNGPWDIARRKQNNLIKSIRIEDYVIKEHYVNKFGGSRVN
jgi:uncharacterized phage-associated protein